MPILLIMGSPVGAGDDSGVGAGDDSGVGVGDDGGQEPPIAPLRS